MRRGDHVRSSAERVHHEPLPRFAFEQMQALQDSGSVQPLWLADGRRCDPTPETEVPTPGTRHRLYRIDHYPREARLLDGVRGGLSPAASLIVSAILP